MNASDQALHAVTLLTHKLAIFVPLKCIVGRDASGKVIPNESENERNRGLD